MASSEAGKEKKTLLSHRGDRSLAEWDFLVHYGFTAVTNHFHPKDNPKGLIDMGMATNRLMEEELESRLQGTKGLKHTRDLQHYSKFYGLLHFRKAAADFLQRHLCPGKLLDFENVVIVNGVASALDILGHALCDPGDVFITMTPIYARIFCDLRERAFVDVVPLNLSQEMDSDGQPFSFNPELLEKKIKELSDEGKNVKGVVLVHPHNPLGDFYSKDKLQKILKICAKHKLHVVADEIYALSVFRKEEEFVSTLALEHVPDPQRLHFVWGLSKDFGLAGFRSGIVYSPNKDVVNCLKNIAVYYSTPSVIQDVCSAFMSDKDWSDNFLSENRRKLRETYEIVSHRLEEIGFKVREAHSGFFVWADGRKFLPEATREAEIELFQEFFDNGVYVVPGTELYCVNPGWFRFIFSINQEYLKIGLVKIKEVLDRRQKRQNTNES